MSDPLGQHRTEEQGSRKRGSGGGYFAAVLKVPCPINRLFEFPPQRACHVSIREGLFLPSVHLLAAGGSHTSHLDMYCCLVPGRLSIVFFLCFVCVRVCTCSRLGKFLDARGEILCFKSTHIFQVNFICI